MSFPSKFPYIICPQVALGRMYLRNTTEEDDRLRLARSGYLGGSGACSMVQLSLSHVYRVDKVRWYEYRNQQSIHIQRWKQLKRRNLTLPQQSMIRSYITNSFIHSSTIIMVPRIHSIPYPLMDSLLVLQVAKCIQIYANLVELKNFGWKFGCCDRY